MIEIPPEMTEMAALMENFLSFRALVGPGSYTPSHQATEDTARRHKFPAEPRPMQSTQLEDSIRTAKWQNQHTKIPT
eukprot:5252013-Amphidinium_carterae.1